MDTERLVKGYPFGVNKTCQKGLTSVLGNDTFELPTKLGNILWEVLL